MEPMSSKPMLSLAPIVELTEIQEGQHSSSVQKHRTLSAGETAIHTASFSISLRVIGKDLSRLGSKFRCPQR